MFHTKVVEEFKTQILCSVKLFFENRAVHEMMWENIAQQGRPLDTNLWHAHCPQATCFLDEETDIPELGL
jgi:hypothetical protein